MSFHFLSGQIWDRVQTKPYDCDVSISSSRKWDPSLSGSDDLPKRTPFSQRISPPPLTPEQKRKHKKKYLVQYTNFYLVDVKRPQAYKTTTVRSQAH